jgi:queuine/archaeosine tRNA-ribosyltransferase
MEFEADFCRGLKPGQEVLDIIGGAHKLQGWKYNILTGMMGFLACL